jgi:hypothetical protein
LPIEIKNKYEEQILDFVVGLRVFDDGVLSEQQEEKYA